MRDMTEAEIAEFLAYSTRTAKLATVGADGHPHVVPVWFVMDGAEFVITTMSTSRKARHLASRPRVSLCVDDERPPYAFVTVHGTATVHKQPSDLLEWTTRIARRYVPGEDAEAVGRRYAEFDDLIVRIRPDRVIARTGITE